MHIPKYALENINMLTILSPEFRNHIVEVTKDVEIPINVARM